MILPLGDKQLNYRIAVVALILVAIVGLVGCAKTSKAPSERSEAAKSFEPVADAGVVYVYRRGRAVGAAGAFQIQVNGKEAGGTGPGTFFRWELKPGSYVISASSGESSAAAELKVEAGKLYFVEQNQRMGLSASRLHLDVRDEATGMKEVQGLKLLISTYVPE